MSITSALSNAYSGLAANARLTEIVSRNVSSAGVDGYAARELTPGSRVIVGEGGGVIVNGPSRAGDAFVTAERRKADARAGADAATAGAARALADLIGTQADGDSLAARYGALEDSLRKLSDSPESPVVRQEAADAARSVARFFNVVSTESQRLRFEADGEIARQVASLNSALSKIDELNKQISSAQAAGRDATSLEDERERQIDVVNAIVPIRAQKRENGAVSLYTEGGGVMLDVSPVPLSFTATAPIAPEMSLEGGDLSNVTFNGRDAAPTAPTNSGLLRGGTLEAAFRARDETIPGFTAQLDALARDLIERFQNPAVDPSLDPLAAPAEAGMFAVGPFGAAFDGTAASQVGLAGRIVLNPLADPEAGGDAARMRDGMGSLATPRSGDPAIALAFLDAFTGLRQPAAPVSAAPPNAAIAGAGFDAPRSAGALAAQVGAMRSSTAARAEQTAAFAQGVAATAQEADLRVSAVDTDAELRNLIALENAYSANARVISAIDQMMRRILEI